ncbi:hypothetical protein ACGFNU_00150 [Spirillospora sp. NPDC048911]|uniref:hypothetical protein n=1 Tax=Spirillospora sp. NPDC048911 TaxID=3364527 RepID=UPI00371BA57A
MRPSATVVLDPDRVLVERDGIALKRACALVEEVMGHVAEDPEVRAARGVCVLSDERFAEAKSKVTRPENVKRIVRHVAGRHPRFLVWLARGRVSRGVNVYGWLAVAALWAPSPFRSWIDDYLFGRVARHAPWRTTLHEFVIQQVRRQINEIHSEILFSHELPTYHGRPNATLDPSILRGLTAATDPAAKPAIPSLTEIERLTERTAAGAIGISGRRGAGKSTAIARFCESRYGSTGPEHRGGRCAEGMPGLRFVIKAPVRYDAREFLIHLYSRLCETVLADPRLKPWSRRRFPVRQAAAAVMLFACAAMVFLAVRGGRPDWSWFSPRVQAWIAASACGIAALLLAGWRSRQALIERRGTIMLAVDARERLERLHYQRKVTTARQLGFATSGATVGTSGSKEMAEQVMTLPELIDDYRDFAERTVAALRQLQLTGGPPESEAAVRLVIGIDEIDRIDDAADAHGFLDDIKAVFGTPYTVYLVAVRPEALLAYPRDGSVRPPALGGVFDETVWIDPLPVEGAVDVLADRVVGLPVPFVLLCHCLSGGFPEDLVRIARQVYGVTVPDGDGSHLPGAGLDVIANRVVAEEIKLLARRAFIQAGQLDVADSSTLLDLLNDHDALVPKGRCDVAARLQTVFDLHGDDPAKWKRFADAEGRLSSAAHVCDSFATSLYFLLTVHEMFVGDLAEDAWKQLELSRRVQDYGDCEPFRGLAEAREVVTTSPYLAWERVSKAREAARPGSSVQPRFLGAISAQP